MPIATCLQQDLLRIVSIPRFCVLHLHCGVQRVSDTGGPPALYALQAQQHLCY
jgi:hypothetical protein